MKIHDVIIIGKGPAGISLGSVKFYLHIGLFAPKSNFECAVWQFTSGQIKLAK